MPGAAFLFAGIIFAIGVGGFFINIAIYMSLDAPSVQGDPSAPWVWLIGGTVISAIVASSHYWHFAW